MLKKLESSFIKSKDIFNRFLFLGTLVFLIGHLFNFARITNLNQHLFLPFLAIFIVYLMEDLMGLDKQNPDNLKIYLKMFLVIYSLMFILNSFSIVFIGFYLIALVGVVFLVLTPFYLADGFSVKESLDNSFLAVKEYGLFTNIAVLILSLLIIYAIFLFQTYIVAIGLIFATGVFGLILDVVIFTLFALVQFRILAWVLEYLREVYESTNDVILKS